MNAGTGRRQWLGGAAAVAAAGTLPAVLGQPVGTPPQRPAAGYAFLHEAEVRFLVAAVDRLIPADDFASASQAGVVVYIDRQLAGPFGRGARMYLQGPVEEGTPEQGYQLALAPAQVYRESLEALLADPQGAGFHERPPAQQDDFLKALERGDWLLGRVPSAVFFETLLANTIEGFFSDPLYGGNRDMVGWRMVGFPGAYAHYTPWVGRHNLRFDRPPIAIASQRTPDPHAAHGGPRAQGSSVQGPVPASAQPGRRQEPR